MNSQFKRMLSFVLSFCMLLTVFPVGVIADAVTDAPIQSSDIEHDEVSTYAIINPDDAHVATYVFNVDGVEYDRQMIKDGEQLVEPEVPEIKHNKFIGWCTADDTLFTDFGVSLAVDATEKIILNAVFEPVYYVFFMDAADADARVWETREGVSDDVIDTYDVTFPVDGDSAITGWYYDIELTNKADDIITIQDENITLYPKVEHGCWVTYVTAEDADYVEPAFVAPGSTVAEPSEIPTRPGYTFSHWSKTEAGEEFEFGTVLEEDLTLYAVWEADNDTEYTILYWIENADDDGYSFESSRVLSGTTGDTVVLSDITNGYSISNIDSSYREYFKYSHYDTDVVIAGDGSTIVNVYFSRNEYTLTFRANRTTVATITAKYDAEISGEFPIEGYEGRAWEATSYYDYALQTLDRMPGQNITFNLYDQSSNILKTIYYYVESLDGSVDTTYEGIGYDILKTVTTYFNYMTYEEEYHPIEGFERFSASDAGFRNNVRYFSNNNEASLYYIRSTYTLEFYNVNSTAKSETVKYEASLADYLTYVPEKPSTVPTEYEFVGWYTSSTCEEGTEAANTLTTMPAGNVVIYAKWAAPTFEGIIHYDMEVNSDTTTIDIPYGTAIDQEQLPDIEVPDGYEMIGWATRDDEGNYYLYNLDQLVYGDIELYPYFVSTAKYTVTYSAGAGSGTVTDSKNYAEYSYADVQSADGLTAPEGMVFLGWEDTDGKLYQPNDKIQIHGNITLTAVWGETVPDTLLTYKANGGEGKDYVVTGLGNNSTVTLITAVDAKFSREGYEFLGWATTANATEPEYEAGDSIIVDTEDATTANVLYAVWKQMDFKVTYEYTGEVPDGAPEVPAQETVTYGTDYTVAAVPVLEGYTFDGWMMDGETVTEFTMPAEDVTLTGSWAIRTDLTYTVNYYWNGTETPVAESKTVENQTYGTEVTETPITVEGYTAVSADSKSITIAEDGNVINFYYYMNVDLTANSGEVTYNGEEQSVSGFTGAPEDADFSAITVGAVGIDAGTYDAEFAEGTTGTVDDTGKYIVTSAEKGTLTIKKKSVTLTSATASKQYDGSPLTAQTVDAVGFVEGQGAAYTVTGTQTLVGSSDNEFTYELNEGTKAENYDIDVVFGKLTVTDRAVKYEISVVANSDKVMYNGKTHAVVGFQQLTFERDSNNYTVEGLTASASGIDVGIYDAVVKGTAVVKDTAGNDVTSQFDVKTQGGKLEVTKRSVTFTSATETREYNGTPLTNKTVTVNNYGFADGEGAAFEVTGSQLAPGSSANTFTYTLNDNTKADNYDITKTEGTLTVTNRDAKYEITVVGNSDTVTYDGNEHSVSGCYVSGADSLTFILPENGKTYTVSGLTASTSGTDAGTYYFNVVGEPIVKDSEGNDVTTEFKINTVSGKLVINKREVTLTSGSATREYNGEALTNRNVEVGGEGWAEGEGASYNVTGSQTLVGSSENFFTYEATAETNFDNYSITANNGTLTVTDRDTKYAIEVEANSGIFKYDGTVKTVEGVKTLNFEVEGNTYTVSGLTASASETDAGEYYVNVVGTATVTDEAGNEVTSQFAVTTKSGILEITKRKVTLTSADDEKMYDGKPLTNSTVTVSGDGFVEGEGASYTVTGTRTLPGHAKNTFTYALNGNTKAKNYDIDTVEGTLTVTNRTDDKRFEITVEANSGVYTYDGTEKTVSGFTNESLVYTFDGVAFTVEGLSASVSKTDAGTYTVEVTGTAVVRDSDNNDVTAQFIVHEIDGQLVINKRNVTLTSATKSKEYDGTPLTNDEVTVSGDGFVEGEGAVYNVTGSQLIVGTSANTFTYTLKSNTLANNYNITEIPGQLTVTDRGEKYEITVVAKSGEFKYDGTEKIVEGFETLTFVENGETFTVSGLTAKQSATNAGTYAVSVDGSAIVTDAYDNDVTEQFTVNIQAGELKITQLKVVLTSATAEMEYDGTPLTNDEVTVSGDGFAAGEGATYNVTGSRTLVGFNDNTFTYTLNEGTLADNYLISTVYGTLTVVTREADYRITVDAKSGEFKYDGEEKSVEGFITLKVIAENGLTYTVEGLTAEGKGTDAGDYVVGVTGTPVVKDADGNDVSSEFAVTANTGKLTITKRNVTLTSANASKQYDGTPLTNDEVTVSGDGFDEGESADYVVTGTQTLVGSSPNYFTYILGAGTKAENYEINKIEGLLTVNHRDTKYEITVEANSGEFKYDGDEKTVTGLKETEFTVEGQLYTVSGLTAEAKAVDAGEYPVNITGTPVVKDKDGNDVSTEFAVIMVSGKLIINKRNVILTSASDFKYFDGIPLRNKNVTVSGDGWAEGEGADYNVTGVRVHEGKSPNTFTYTLWDNTKASNYNITKIEGTLELDVEFIIPKPDREGDVTLTKVDSVDNTTKLAGAKFQLYKVTGGRYDEFIGQYTSDRKGKIEVEDLEPGRYYWVEIGAPEGYTLDDEEHYFTISIGKTTLVTVENVKTAIPDVFGLDHYAYVIGYPDGGVHPESTITRAEVATIFFRLLSDEVRELSMTKDNDFTDVNEGDWYNTAVSTMAAMGVVKGYPDGSFRPNGKITRAEFAAIAARFDQNGNTTPATFTDIYDHWGLEEISIAANNGWILGYTDNTFKPNKYITRAEAMTLVNRVLQRIVEDEDDLLDDMITWYDNMDTEKWYYLAVQEATNSHYYIRKENGFEIWTEIRPVRDWTKLED